MGDESNSLDSSVGAGVAKFSPVAVSTTPFMAEGRKAAYVGRTTGVSRAVIRIGAGFGLGVGWLSNFRRRWIGVVSRYECGWRRFLTSSSGFLSFRPT